MLNYVIQLVVIQKAVLIDSLDKGTVLLFRISNNKVIIIVTHYDCRM